ncbi:hypothetical protein KKA23_01025 [Patescibacteria group bacterium]|nr:hypothetical protein [Patescibacteria group bacterium]
MKKQKRFKFILLNGKIYLSGRKPFDCPIYNIEVKKAILYRATIKEIRKEVACYLRYNGGYYICCWDQCSFKCPAKEKLSI